MAYPPRLFQEGSWYHVYTRGQREEPLFFSPQDRRTYLKYLDEEMVRRDGFVGSFCLMVNHVHLLIQMGEIPLDRIFHSVHTSYAKYFNHKRDTSGHVFQGRPGMKIVLDEKYLFGLVQYIHQNPVEADLVDSVFDYDWSSWRRFLDGKKPKISLETWVYPPGFEEHSQREQQFLSLNEAEKVELPEGKNYWGTEAEWQRLEKRREGREGRKFKERRGIRSMEEIVEEVLSESDVTLGDVQSASRARRVSKVRHRAMRALYREGHNPTAIGKFFNRTPSTVHYALNRELEE